MTTSAMVVMCKNCCRDMQFTGGEANKIERLGWTRRFTCRTCNFSISVHTKD